MDSVLLLNLWPQRRSKKISEYRKEQAVKPHELIPEEVNDLKEWQLQEMLAEGLQSPLVISAVLPVSLEVRDMLKRYYLNKSLASVS